jgi:NAD(P)H-dependent FMN reductase
MKPLLIIHAGAEAGATRQLVEAALAGAQSAEPDVPVLLRPALAAGPADLELAGAVLFATPEKFGYMAGALKDFFDRSFYPLEGRVAGLGYALIVSAGNDGLGAVESVQRIARGFPLDLLAPPLRVVGPPTEADLAEAHALGAALSAGLALGVF